MSNILGASSEVVAPYASVEHGRDRIGSVADQRVRPRHHYLELLAQRHRPHGRVVGHAADQPANAQRLSLIWGEVTYPYTPSMGYVITGTINIYQSIYFYPRLSNSVTLSSCS